MPFSSRPNPVPSALSGKPPSTPVPEEGCRSVLDMMVQHCQAWVEHGVGVLARSTSLTAADRDDAQQEILLAVVKAILPRLSAPPRAADFRAFVDQIIRTRFNTFLRDHARYLGHFDHAVDVYLLAEQGVNPALVLTEGAAGDPTVTAIACEEHDRLEEALQRLSTADRMLVHKAAAGLSREEMAATEGTSRRTLGRQWARILRHLRSWLVNSSACAGILPPPGRC
jgi:RNA polymerase sigma factor (sigma-70 family)